MLRVGRRLQRVVGQQSRQRPDPDQTLRFATAMASTQRHDPFTAARRTPAGLEPMIRPVRGTFRKATSRTGPNASTTTAAATVVSREPGFLSGQRPGSPATPRHLAVGGAPRKPTPTLIESQRPEGRRPRFAAG